MTPRILIGTSGWQYDEWAGVLYPREVPRTRYLDYYAGVFPCVEINATYYGTPGRHSAARAVREARGRLAFSIKAPADMTHRGRFGRDVVAPFLGYIEPYRDGGVLAAVLMQFPGGLHNTPQGRAQVALAAELLDGCPIAVELRHASWDTPEADRFLADMQASRVAVDQPELRALSRPSRLAQTGPLAYFRFHGRNAAAWFGDGRGTGEARYRYKYRAGELAPWAPIVRDAAAGATSTLVFFNNHPDGNAVLDAIAFSEMLGCPITLPESGDLFG